ncbi:MAG: 30S ribosomal protein S16 [Defluviitaleaceae bacterium]|nr:30S ribosomal protein S16 [Defluviitaleaceae bacterium]
MVKIRLKRFGAKKKPFYRIVVADSRSPRDGKVIAQLGYYDPMQEPSLVKVDVEQAQQWIKNGAQPTDKVRALLTKAGAIAE